MGTNYYLKVNVCPHCDKPEDVLHIGKSSGGWCFSLHVDPERGINDIEDWEARWPSGVIQNEYGDTLTIDEMRRVITERRWKEPPTPRPADFYRSNYAEPGPNGLTRHVVGPHCVKHGEGTWDCVLGEFS